MTFPMPFICPSYVARSVELVHTSAAASEVANYGPEATNRWIVVIPITGNSFSSYTINATMAGTTTTRINYHTSGNGSGSALGTAIVVGQPTGTSGLVSATASIDVTRRFHVLRVVGYNLSSAVYTSTSNAAGVPPWLNVNVPADGFTLGVLHRATNITHVWTGLTKRVAENVLVNSKTNSLAWNINMLANTSHDVSCSASDTDGTTSALVATFAPY